MPLGDGLAPDGADEGGVDGGDHDDEPDEPGEPPERAPDDPAGGAIGSDIWISAMTSPFRTSSTTIIPFEVPR